MGNTSLKKQIFSAILGTVANSLSCEGKELSIDVDTHSKSNIRVRMVPERVMESQKEKESSSSRIVQVNQVPKQALLSQRLRCVRSLSLMLSRLNYTVKLIW